MQIGWLPVVTIRASGALIDCSFSELAWMRRKSSVGQEAALGSNFCSSTVRTQIDKLAVCKATILCLARNHCSVRSSTSFGGGRSCSTANSSCDSAKLYRQMISTTCCVRSLCRRSEEHTSELQSRLHLV